MSWIVPRGVATNILVRNSLCHNSPHVAHNISHLDDSSSSTTTSSSTTSSSMSSNVDKKTVSSCGGAHTLVPLVVNNPNRISWYSCGPTVYDVAHLGHARTFVCIDIMQRLLQDRFGFGVDSVMNVTDVDDKLLRRAAELQREPRALAREMEASFLADMRSLNVRPPIRLTRVTEFVPEIVALIERIVGAGFAYESNGSVYFDVRARLRASTHPRLMPSRIVRFADPVPPSQHDDEGAAPADKRFWADFALWKAVPAVAGIDGAKELVWMSPFGPGRPGWHIECSAMARAAFGDELDVHAGGIDLRFPHHENEILQCDALNDGRQPDRQWPNYFLHVGHVQIAGQKMSKSLKNFQSIREFLDAHSADAFRWFCLMHRYDDAVEYHEQAMADARRQAERVREFLDMLERHLAAPIAASAVWNEHETSLQRRVFASRVAIDAHLRNNFDTASTLHELNRLITAVSSYIGAHPQRVAAARGVLANTAAFVMTLMDEFGLRAHRQQHQLQAGDGAAARAAAVAAAACGIRDRVRVLARSVEHQASSTALWKLADEIRDELLPKVGVEVRDDADGKKSHWRWQEMEEAQARDGRVHEKKQK